MKKSYFILPAFILLLAACQQKPEFDYYYYSADEIDLLSQYLNLPNAEINYAFSLPAHLAHVPVMIDSRKATLGRVLFYDKNLSADGTIACASCHKQELGFADNAAFSKGVNGHVTARNSLSLSAVTSFAVDYGTDLNGSGAFRFFWDNRAETAAVQSRGSLTNPREMGMTMHEVVTKIGSLPYYKPLFVKAFKDDAVNEERVLESIESFVNSIGSFDSKFDREANKTNLESFQNILGYPKPFSDFTSEENHGKDVYNQFCAGCHSGNFSRPLFAFANNGLDEDTSPDQGVGGVTGSTLQMGCFKVPSLRNIALTAPYMHDGRFASLEEVIDHYNSGIKMHPNLDPRLRDPANSNEPLRMNLTSKDKYDLIQFLNTLTDYSLQTTERFSDPFIR